MLKETMHVCRHKHPELVHATMQCYYQYSDWQNFTELSVNDTKHLKQYNYFTIMWWTIFQGNMTMHYGHCQLYTSICKNYHCINKIKAGTLAYHSKSYGTSVLLADWNYSNNNNFSRDPNQGLTAWRTTLSIMNLPDSW